MKNSGWFTSQDGVIVVLEFNTANGKYLCHCRLLSPEAKALKDRSKRSRNKQGRYVQPAAAQGTEGKLPAPAKS